MNNKKKMTREEQLSIKPNEDFIPNVGLGEFIVGYTGKKVKFPKKMLWWLLVPFLGWSIVVSFVVVYYIFNLFVGKYTIYVYEDGFLWVEHPSIFSSSLLKGKDKETLIRYDDIGGFRHWVNVSVRVQFHGNVVFDICNKEGCSIFKRDYPIRGGISNDRFPPIYYAIPFIHEKCEIISTDRFYSELKEKGYGTFFYLQPGIFQRITEVQIGNNFIKTENNCIKDNFDYDMDYDNNLLKIYPGKKDDKQSRKKSISIYLWSVYNEKAFKKAVNQLLGTNFGILDE